MTKVDIIIPAFNEERFIMGCLQSVVAFEREPDIVISVYVVDGASTDRTREIVLEMADRFPEIHLLHNAKRIQSCALNKALRCGDGDYVLRLDAHAQYPRDYLMRCLNVSRETKADNVGGVVITRPGSPGFQARLVQAITTHWFGVGNSGFRLGVKAGPADTVPYGFFRRTIFDGIGYFDERLIRAQDYEFNRRIIASGGTVWLDPCIEVYYYNMPSMWSFCRKQILREGCYNAYLWYLAPYAFAFRHCVTGAFACGVLAGCLGSVLTPLIAAPFAGIMIVYFILAGLASLQQARRYRMASLAVALPLCFFLFHISHGLGVLGGLLNLCARSAAVQKLPEPWPGAGRFRAWPIPSIGKNSRLVSASITNCNSAALAPAQPAREVLSD
jgi:glycosyltransferase involved in cell wall biosynthesis